MLRSAQAALVTSRELHAAASLAASDESMAWYAADETAANAVKRKAADKAQTGPAELVMESPRSSDT